ncbi:hypothetical protein K4F52_002528 [Lecanicillium sp. MT-2017a]|nr:hypothetical protein K4F52_002528 [Lecanicillium sp. MT-2017a]
MAFTPGLITPPETPKYNKHADTDAVEPNHGVSTSDTEAKPAGLEHVSELIYSIIEHAVEEKIAEAIGPLRLNLRRMDRENSDFHEQNDTLSRQIDLHYKSIEKHNDVLDNLSSAQARAIETQAKLTQHATENICQTTANLSHATENLSQTNENLSLATSLVTQLAHLTANLPSSIHQAVADSVQEQVQLAIRQVMAAKAPEHHSYYNGPGSSSGYSAPTTNRWNSSSSSSASTGRSFMHDDEILKNGRSSRTGSQSTSVRRKLARLFRCSRWRS